MMTWEKKQTDEKKRTAGGRDWRSAAAGCSDIQFVENLIEKTGDESGAQRSYRITTEQELLLHRYGFDRDTKTARCKLAGVSSLASTSRNICPVSTSEGTLSK